MVRRYFRNWLVRPESLVDFDPASGFRDPVDRTLARIIFGAVVSLVVMIPLRIAIDQFSNSAGPYALIYPPVVIATVLGRKTAGFAALLVCFFWVLASNVPTFSWYHLPIPREPGRFLVNLLSTTFVILVTSLFRKVADSALAERDQEIAHRKMLALELEHRSKNNFAMVSSLLSLQKRRDANPDTVAALDQAIRRIQTFAGAYADLSVREEGGQTDVPAYLRELVARVASAAFDGEVTVEVESDPLLLPRETAVAIGLFVNEALTNCAKYAFPAGATGKVQIRLKTDRGRWHCTVSDDGPGSGQRAEKGSGLGVGLMDAFARQAGAKVTRPPQERGYAIRLAVPDPDDNPDNLA